MTEEDDDDYEQKAVEKIEEIHEDEIEALRRAGVAEQKREGLRIESTEAIRLFREAQGYILRLRELRESLEDELEHADYYHISRVTGNIDDYNRILRDIRDNRSFESCVESFERISCSPQRSKNRYRIRIGGSSGQSEWVPGTYDDGDEELEYVPMDGTTIVEMFVYPRIIRLTEDVEQSLFGRCASGKRP
jgi:hypothetical protein